MKRHVTGFERDAEGHWVARLDCHHRQHVRHHPPQFDRPWTATEEGRASRIGMALECVRCDDFEWPAGLARYRTTPRFVGGATPAGLLRDHSTKRGVWGRIVVEEGSVVYVAGARRCTLRPGAGGSAADGTGVVVPEMKHHVEPAPDAVFAVEFWRPPG